MLIYYVAKKITMIESIEEVKFLGIKLINSGDFFELLLRLLLNTFVVYLITYKVYLKSNKNYQFYFGYNDISIVTFLMCFLFFMVLLERVFYGLFLRVFRVVSCRACQPDGNAF